MIILLLRGQNKHCEGVTLGSRDGISHQFYKPDNQSN